MSIDDMTMGGLLNQFADTQVGIIRIWLVQHAGFPGDGGKAQGAFMKAAIDGFGKR